MKPLLLLRMGASNRGLSPMRSLCVVFLHTFAITAALHQPTFAIGPENVLVLYYDDQTPAMTAGEEIADHYVATHGPAVRTLGLNFATPPGEDITAQEYLSDIRAPLLASGMLTPDIEVIVTTKGLPLRIDTSAQGPGRHSSLESELARVDMINSVAQMSDQNWIQADFGTPNVPSANPYYLGPNILTGDKRPLTPFNRTAYEGIRLTSRLDGFTVQDVTSSIDRANEIIYASDFTAKVVVDDNPFAGATTFTRMEAFEQELAPTIYADNDITTPGLQSDNFQYENTSVPVITSDLPVIGYISHGVHGNLQASTLGQLDTTGYIIEDLDFELAPGAIFHTYESFNAYTFDPTSTATGQGQVAQWLAAGGTAGLGHVAEPVASIFNVSNEDVLFDMLFNGYTYVEAAWAATRQLSFVNTVVGDPLMRFTDWLPGDFNTDTVVALGDLNVIGSNFGAGTATLFEGDLNGDNQVNLQDIGIFTDNFGMQAGDTISAGSGPTASFSFASANVPEPSTFMLAACLLCLVPARSRASSN